MYLVVLAKILQLVQLSTAFVGLSRVTERAALLHTSRAGLADQGVDCKYIG